MRSIQSSNPGRRQRGATLIEVLVAILVLSIAMLGIAGLTSASMRYSQGSWARATIASALGDLGDRVRTNPASSTTAYVQTTTTYADQQATSYALSFTTNCSTSTCASANDLAAYQLEQWRLSVKQNLPSSGIWISGTRDTGYLATIMWFDKSFLQLDGTNLDASTTCVNTITNAMAQRACCPSGAQVPAGVRCTNMTIVP